MGWLLHNAGHHQWFPPAAPYRFNQIPVHLSDELQGYLLGTHRLTFAVIGTTPEMFIHHRGHHCERPLITLGLTLWKLRWVIFAEVKSMAAAFGQEATHAPQPMHAAASKAVSAASFETRTALASGALPVGALIKPPA
jgi:hypothetical protein